MRTDFTNKLRLAPAIRFFTVAADTTCAACIARVNGNQAYAFTLRLVGQERSELRKSPVGMLGSVFPPNSCPRAYVLQILYSNRPVRVFGFRDKFLADSMVHVALIAALLTAQFLESALGRWSAYLLQDASTLLIPLAILLYSFAAIALTVRVGSDVGDAKVNAKRVINLLRRRLWNLAHGKQKELAFAIDQIRFALTGFKHFLLSFTANVRDRLATANSPDIDELLLSSPCQNAVIKSNRAKRFEFPASMLVQLVSIGNFGNTAHHNLSRKPAAFSNVRVKGFMDGVLPKSLRSPRKLTYPITSGVSLLKRFFEKSGLLSARIQFDLRYQFHTRSITQLQYLKQAEARSGRFGLLGLSLLPALKYEVSALTNERHYG